MAKLRNFEIVSDELHVYWSKKIITKWNNNGNNTAYSLRRKENCGKKRGSESFYELSASFLGRKVSQYGV
jgi:hypothetical protein